MLTCVLLAAALLSGQVLANTHLHLDADHHNETVSCEVCAHIDSGAAAPSIDTTLPERAKHEPVSTVSCIPSPYRRAFSTHIPRAPPALV